MTATVSVVAFFILIRTGEEYEARRTFKILWHLNAIINPSDKKRLSSPLRKRATRCIVKIGGVFYDFGTRFL